MHWVGVLPEAEIKEIWLSIGFAYGVGLGTIDFNICRDNWVEKKEGRRMSISLTIIIALLVLLFNFRGFLSVVYKDNKKLKNQIEAYKTETESLQKNIAYLMKKRRRCCEDKKGSGQNKRQDKRSKNE